MPQAAAEEAARDFQAFTEAVSARLEKGATEYAANPAMDRRLSDVVAELEQECLDLAGWGFFLWCKLKRVEATLKGGMR